MVPLWSFLSTTSYRATVRCSAAQALSQIFLTLSTLPENDAVIEILPTDCDEESFNKLSLSCLGIFGDCNSEVQVWKQEVWQGWVDWKNRYWIALQSFLSARKLPQSSSLRFCAYVLKGLLYLRYVNGNVFPALSMRMAITSFFVLRRVSQGGPSTLVYYVLPVITDILLYNVPFLSGRSSLHFYQQYLQLNSLGPLMAAILSVRFASQLCFLLTLSLPQTASLLHLLRSPIPQKFSCPFTNVWSSFLQNAFCQQQAFIPIAAHFQHFVLLAIFLLRLGHLVIQFQPTTMTHV